jgi:SAM-dependent methyltransferase
MKGAPGDPVWNSCWAQWDAKSGYKEDIRQHREERGSLYALLESALAQTSSKPPRILEVACGTAIDACLLAQSGHRQVIGADRALGAVTVARKISRSFPQPIQFCVSDGFQLSFSDEAFDLVFSQGFLEHFRDPRPLLREQVRVLKRGGHLIVDVPSRYAGLGTYSLRKHWKIWRGVWPWGWETEFSVRQLKGFGRRLGLEPLGVASYGWDGLFTRLKKLHPRLFQALSRRWGHWFLICIAVDFRKP